MQVHKNHIICYSPTGTTRKSLEHMAAGMGLETGSIADLTLPEAVPSGEPLLEKDIVLIGAPVYAGRVAPTALERLGRFKGNNTPAVVVVTYGNRDYENALIELKKHVEDLGFVPVAGAAVIGEHSYSSDEKPIGAGRPDEEDVKMAFSFGVSVMEKLRLTQDLTEMLPIAVPGTLPAEPYPGPRNVSPETDPQACTLCRACEKVCPMAAITVKESVDTDPALCTMCSACIKTCPTGARKILVPRILERIGKVYANTRNRREPEFFI